MSFGELTGGGLRAYYKLENTTDSGPNGFTLTNTGVSFNPARFSSGADMGSSGSTQALEQANNILSTTTVDQIYVGFWWRLKTTADTGTRICFAINTVNNATTGRYYDIIYTITSGSITISARRGITTPAFLATSLTFSVNTTDWYYTALRRFGNDLALIVVNKSGVLSTNVVTDATSGASLNLGASTPKFTLGTNIAKSVPAYMTIDEFVVSESLYSEFAWTDARSKYYNQARGFLI